MDAMFIAMHKAERGCGSSDESILGEKEELIEEERHWYKYCYRVPLEFRDNQTGQKYPNWYNVSAACAIGNYSILWSPAMRLRYGR